GPRFVVAVIAAGAVGAVAGALVERGLVRHLYGKHVEQILLTIGLGMAAVALMGGWFSYDARLLTQPTWFLTTTTIAGASIPNNRLLILTVAVALLAGQMLFLNRTRHGLIIRA